MNSFSRLVRTAVAGTAALVFCTAAFAQMAPAIQTFNQESTLPFDRIAFAGTPNIPANILASITGGALEVRQVVEQRNDGGLRVRHILVAPNSPFPTPANTETQVLEDYLVRVDNVVRWPSMAMTAPGTAAMEGSIVYIGTVSQESVNSPFGAIRDQPFIYAVGYRQSGSGSSMTTTFTNATLVIPGRLTTFIANPRGTLMFPSTGGGGTTPPGPTIGIAERITTLQTDVELDAMATDAGTGPLTYSWRLVRGTANILQPTAARPRVQVPAIFGEHVLEVTVTNAAGQSTTKQFVIFFAGSSGF